MEENIGEIDGTVEDVVKRSGGKGSSVMLRDVVSGFICSLVVLGTGTGT